MKAIIESGYRYTYSLVAAEHDTTTPFLDNFLRENLTGSALHICEYPKSICQFVKKY